MHHTAGTDGTDRQNGENEENDNSSDDPDAIMLGGATGVFHYPDVEGERRRQAVP